MQDNPQPFCQSAPMFVYLPYCTTGLQEIPETQTRAILALCGFLKLPGKRVRAFPDLLGSGKEKSQNTEKIVFMLQ